MPTPPNNKPPAVAFDDILAKVQAGIDKDEEEMKNKQKKYREGEGIEQPLAD